jgi:ribosome-interacting GTPase 1
VTDLSDDPLTQMEAITGQLENLRIGIGTEQPQEAEGRVLHRKKAFIIGNKIDLEGASQNYARLHELYQDRLPVIAISASKGTGLEEMRLKIYQMLDIMRVYTKTPGGKPDFNDPIILDRGSTMEDAAAEVHKDFRARLKYARVWGSGKHDGIMVKRDHVLQDGDIIELHV